MGIYISILTVYVCYLFLAESAGIAAEAVKGKNEQETETEKEKEKDEDNSTEESRETGPLLYSWNLKNVSI